jgi:VWFA-related protein
MRRTLVAVLLLVLPSAAIGQGPSPLYRINRDQIEKEGMAADRVYVARRNDPSGASRLFVTIHFIITRDGKPTTEVEPEEIVVSEDGRPVTDLEVHAPRSNEPLTSVLAFDTSGSMAEHGKWPEAQGAARTFLDLLDPRADCGLVLFDHELRVKEKPRMDRSRIRHAVDEAEPRGGTAYFDATAEALSMLKDARGRRAVVLLTDGVDLNSSHTLNEVVHQAREMQVPIYTVGVGEPGRNEPVNSVLVLDCSGSMNEPATDSDEISKISALREAAGRFVDIMRPGARTTLLPFNHKLEKVEDFTDNKQALKQRIRRLRAGGGTFLYDATFTAIATLEAAEAAGKRAVVVLTDGIDEGVNGGPGSRHRYQEVIERAREAQVPLHMLALGKEGEFNEKVMREMAEGTGGTFHHASDQRSLFHIFEDLSIQLHDDGIDEVSLRHLAEATDGKYYSAKDISKLRLIYQGLASDLQNSYTVTFPSFRQDYDGTLRDIDVSIWRRGAQVSDVLRGGYNVPGVVVPEMDGGVYLSLLAVLGVLLVLPTGLRYYTRRMSAGGSASG